MLDVRVDRETSQDRIAIQALQVAIRQILQWGEWIGTLNSISRCVTMRAQTLHTSSIGLSSALGFAGVRQRHTSVT